MASDQPDYSGSAMIALPFGDPAAEAIAPYARVAFAQGWASSGGPMTERVKAGCAAAVQLAIDNAHDPDVLEVTLHLGHLEGTWAKVYQRREALYATHIKAVTTAWRRAAARIDVITAVRRFRQSLGLSEAADPNDTAHRQLIAKAIAAAVASVIAGEGAPPADREAIITAIADALKAAEAEGYAGAIAIGADQLGVIGVSFDLAFKDAWDALGDLGTYWADATGWLNRILDGNAADLGAKLSGLAADGASFEDMVDAAGDIIGSTDIRAVSTLVDLAMSQSFSRGALSLYRREGVQHVDFISAGDGRVCPRCLRAESGNPWPLNDVPTPGLHVLCRCNLQASDPMEALNLANYLDVGGS